MVQATVLQCINQISLRCVSKAILSSRQATVHCCTTPVSLQASRHVLLRPLARRNAATAAASCWLYRVERRAASACLQQGLQCCCQSQGPDEGRSRLRAGKQCCRTAPQAAR